MWLFFTGVRSHSNIPHFLSPDKKVVTESSPKPRRSFFGLMFKLLVLLLLGLAGVAAACRLTDLKREAMCVPVNTAVDDGLSWAKQQEGVVRELVQNLSSAAKEFLESTRASKNWTVMWLQWLPELQALPSSACESWDCFFLKMCWNRKSDEDGQAGIPGSSSEVPEVKSVQDGLRWDKQVC